MNQKNRAKILILGIGNILLSDEGIGPRVIEYLQTQELPDGVELMDGGTAGADLLDVLADREVVIIIDAITADYPPGSIVKFMPEQLLPIDVPQLSLHSVDLPQTLQMTAMIGSKPSKAIIIGIKPYSIEPSMELTGPMKEKVAEIGRIVLKEISLD